MKGFRNRPLTGLSQQTIVYCNSRTSGFSLLLGAMSARVAAPAPVRRPAATLRKR